MKVCKDCIHYDVCDHFVKIRTETLSSIQQSEDCLFFKDKSKFIKLPCSIGDVTYAITSEENAEIIQVQVSMIEIQPTYYRIWIQDTKDTNGIWWITDNLYNELASFSTREEAQKKLEEINGEVQFYKRK